MSMLFHFGVQPSVYLVDMEHNCSLRRGVAEGVDSVKAE